jgi:hypothetical protein
MSGVTEGLARSVQTRLASHARAIGVDPNLVLTRFATERLLYRLSVSPHAERFVLKGALVLLYSSHSAGGTTASPMPTST